MKNGLDKLAGLFPTIAAVLFLACLAVVARVPGAQARSGKVGAKHEPLISSEQGSIPLPSPDIGKAAKRASHLPDPIPRFEYISPDFDIPIIVNEHVWREIISLQHGSRHVRTVLERRAYYEPLLKQGLFNTGCPRDMIYLAMVESNFSPTARSVMNAAGMWQLMPVIAEKYGLKNTDWIDERLDLVKSSEAAGKYIMELYERFEDWPLVFAAYNSGPTNISKLLRSYDTTDFWELADIECLRAETRQFVPKVYAAMLVGKFPERFGITGLNLPEKMQYTTVKAPPLTDIYVISKISGAPYQLMANLNAQYLYETTPPWPGGWTIRVPTEYAEGLQEKLDALVKEKRNRFISYRVGERESLASVARRFRVNERVILQANGLNSWRQVEPGKRIKIPVRKMGPTPLVTREPEIKKEDGKYSIRYVVGRGDSLWMLARTIGVSVGEVGEWNDMEKDETIYPGQNLVLYCPDYSTALELSRRSQKNRKENLFSMRPVPKTVYHVVKPGESLSHVAAKYNVTVKQLAEWNGLSDPNRVRAGLKLKIFR